MIRFLPLLLALSPVPVGAQGADRPAGTVQVVLDRGLRAYESSRTLRAAFTQVLTNSLTGTTATANGELLMRKPDQLSVVFHNPRGDRIVADGRMLWVYLPSQNPKQVIRVPQGRGDAGANGLNVIGQFFDAPARRFTISEAGTARLGGRATHALLLVPRSGTRVPFTRATVWIDDRDGQLRQFEVVDANGLVRRVTFTRVSVNPSLPGNTFRFIVPDGAQVVQQPGV